ncbi:MAG: hypothetical protein Ct9H90mP8_1280 [Pseudomonadota bacterium]|nr:MAG: hypothetical protein Ct9H90mP8_1280 [Pseudomonadota bacterium]
MRAKHGVTLRLGKTFDSSNREIFGGFDEVILATGVKPRGLNLEGSKHPKGVLSYLDVLEHEKPVGEKVAIFGQEESGLMLLIT